MRRKWVYDPETKEMVEVTNGPGPASVDAPAVFGDLKPIISPVDGTVITDRGAYRRFLKNNDLVPECEMKGVPERARAERAKREKQERLRTVIDSYEHVRNQNRAKSRFG